MRNEDLDDELSSHLEFQTRKHIAAGMSESEARRRARMEFGGLDLTKEQCRDVDPWRRLNHARRDLQYAARVLAKSPGFSIVAVLILGIGIGATVGAFRLVDAVLFRPVGVARPSELIRIASIDKEGRLGQLPSLILDPLRSSSWLSGVCGFDTSYESADLDGTMSAVGILAFSGDCFTTLGVGIQRGRAIIPSDDESGAGPVAVITARLWHTAYGGRDDVIGRVVHMPGASFTIVGVTDDRFAGLLLGFPAGVIIPLHQEPSSLPAHAKQLWWSVNVIGRRVSGIPAKQAEAALAAQTGWLLEHSVPPRYDAARRRQYLARQLAAAPAATGVDYFLRRRFGGPLIAVLGICIAVLGIACVNLANLMLARALRRKKEIAVRLALGAGSAQVAGMLALESTLLVGVGALLSVPFSVAVGRLVLSQGAEMFSNFGLDLGFDSRVAVFFALLVLAIAGALAGAAVFQARRLCRQGGLQLTGRRAELGQAAAQKVLIAAQVALTLALVSGAGLFNASVRSLYHLDLGIQTHHVWDVLLGSRPAGYDTFAPGPYYRDLVRQMETIPGIRSAVLTDFIPLYSVTSRNSVAMVEGGEPGQELQTRFASVTDGFFGAMGMRILAGEDFRRDQPSGREPAAIVSRALAERLGGVSSILGRHIRIGTSTEYQKLKIIGVSSDAQLELSDPHQLRPFMVYVNSWQHPDALASYPVLLLQGAGGTLPAAAVRQAIDRAGREYAQRIRSIDAEKDGALVEDRVMAYLSAAFGVLALVLAATGLFGLLSYHVANRTAEIGLRMALGARSGQIQRLVLGQIGGLLLAGSAAGVLLAELTGKAIGRMLFGVEAGDPGLLAGAFAIMTATALVAAWLPARRAASVDPLVALRHE